MAEKYQLPEAELERARAVYFAVIEHVVKLKASSGETSKITNADMRAFAEMSPEFYEALAEVEIGLFAEAAFEFYKFYQEECSKVGILNAEFQRHWLGTHDLESTFESRIRQSYSLVFQWLIDYKVKWKDLLVRKDEYESHFFGHGSILQPFKAFFNVIAKSAFGYFIAEGAKEKEHEVEYRRACSVIEAEQEKLNQIIVEIREKCWFAFVECAFGVN